MAFDENDTKVQKVLKLVNTGAGGLKRATTMAAGKKDLKSFLKSQKTMNFKKQQSDDLVVDEVMMKPK